VFSPTTQSSKVWNVQNYNLACSLIWLQNLVGRVEGKCPSRRKFQDRVLRSTFWLKKEELGEGLKNTNYGAS
jgi:hypothetical protein